MWGAIISAATGAIGGALGTASKSQQIKEQKESVNNRMKNNQAWYDRRYNEDATQRADTQRLLSATEEAIKRRNRAAEGRAAMMGGTEESVEGVREQGNNAMANTVSQIAAQAANRKDEIEKQYIAKQDELNKEYQELEAQTPNGMDYAGNIIGGIGSGLGSGLGLGIKK